MLSTSSSRRSAAALILALTTAIPVAAQRPDSGHPRGVTRLALEATILGGAPAAASFEANGSVIELDALHRKLIEEHGAGPAPRLLLERVVLQVLKEELVRQKAWLDDDDYEAAYAEYAKPYDETPFTVNVIATRFKGYPDLQVFQQRWRVLESFVRTLPADAFGDAALAAEAKASRDLLVGTGLTAEWWFHPAAMAADGRLDFATATQQASRTVAALRADAGKVTLADGVTHEVAGAKPMQLNPLRGKLGESEFTSLLRSGVAEAMMAATPGELIGPLRGTNGVYIARVQKRHEPDRDVDLTDARVRELVVQLLRQRQFEAWVDRVFQAAVLRLPPPSPAPGDRR